MFAATPSPDKCSIKEANDHLQLLHQRVLDLEKTVQEQAESLIRKDDEHQMRIRDIIAEKDAKLDDLLKTIEENKDKVKRSDQLLREKDFIIEQLTQRYVQVEDLTSFVPMLERLLSSLRKVPTTRTSANKNQVVHNRTRSRASSKSHSNKVDNSYHSKKSPSTSILTNGDGNNHDTRESHSHANYDNAMDTNSVGQVTSDLKIKRSFKINSNFSMSEDDLDNGDLT